MLLHEFFHKMHTIICRITLNYDLANYTKDNKSK